MCAAPAKRRRPGATRAQRVAVVQIGRRMYERHLVAASDGNISCRLGGGRILLTATGVSKGDLRPRDLVEVPLEASVLPDRASTEGAMHVAIYRACNRVGAVIHAHPPAATAFAVAGEGLTEPVLPEAVVHLGPVPLVPYATPGSGELIALILPFLDRHDGLLLANHGVLTVGRTLLEAYQRLETLEQAAQVLLGARLVGKVSVLAGPEARRLEEIRSRIIREGPRGSAGPYPGGCATPPRERTK